jgi:antitoxin (DNA-binding transcriptional repressor) of toxin-antitoxin stability system
MDKNQWKVGEAKQQFSELLRRSESAPQLIYRRHQLVAAVVAVDETNVANISTPVTIGDRIEEAGELFRRENYTLSRTARKARPNAFIRTLNAVADRHERS